MVNLDEGIIGDKRKNNCINNVDSDDDCDFDYGETDYSDEQDSHDDKSNDYDIDMLTMMRIRVMMMIDEYG